MLGTINLGSGGGNEGRHCLSGARQAPAVLSGLFGIPSFVPQPLRSANA
jgi:hypothetical protein